MVWGQEERQLLLAAPLDLGGELLAKGVSGERTATVHVRDVKAGLPCAAGEVEGCA